MVLLKIAICVFLAIVFIAFVATWLVGSIFSDVEPYRFENEEEYY